MKMLGLLLFLIVFVIAISNLATIFDSSNGMPDVFSRLFPEKYVDPEQETARKNLEAPFDIKGQPVDPNNAEISYDPLSGNVSVISSLDVPHRQERDISQWVTESITALLTFSLTNYVPHMQNMQPYFNANGLNEFQDFLNTANVLLLMQNQNYELRAFVRDIPTLQNAGAIGGVYKWMYDVPVSLTFLPQGVKDYSNLRSGQYIFEEITFRIQMGRVPLKKTASNQLGAGHEGIVIETWKALPKKRK